MKISIYLNYIIVVFLFSSCIKDNVMFDASGQFETNEIIISSKIGGELFDFDIEEGDIVKKGTYIGCIDTIQLHLEKCKLIAKKKSIQHKSINIFEQIAGLKEQIKQTQMELSRNERLVRSNAGIAKKNDDLLFQLEILQKELKAKISTLKNANNSIYEEGRVIDIQIAQINDKIDKSMLYSPITGNIICLFIKKNELALEGAPLFKIAETSKMYLRAYITAAQLSQIKLGDCVKVYIFNNGSSKEYNGKVTWITEQAEFTPKTIQTNDERENLVYAIKVLVPNDGHIKIGMYGDIKFPKKNVDNENYN